MNSKEARVSILGPHKVASFEAVMVGDSFCIAP